MTCPMVQHKLELRGEASLDVVNAVPANINIRQFNKRT